MADWKQITARIRRARGSKDPAGQLSLLFEKTKDAMVAFELGRHFEIVRDSARALQWYQTAAAKFRRGDWKTKASEAVARLGGEMPAGATQNVIAVDSEVHETPMPTMVPPSEPGLPFEQATTVLESPVAAGAENPPVASSEAPVDSEDQKRRRRGRRGGRNRNKKSQTSSATEAHTRTTREPRSAHEVVAEGSEIAPPRTVDARSIPRVPVEQVPETSATGVRGRFGDPGLSSRLSRLEMQLRRLLTCPPAKLGHAEHAPAGPGVFVLTDDDMTTYYHVEACDTLRLAISNLARSGATRRGNSDLKPLLADHLGIPEARASKYLADHCVVRWLQLDEGAAQFAHFAIAVLRPILNE